MMNEKVLGGAGCDIVTPDNSPFRPRKGKIFFIVVRETGTTIEYIEEESAGAIETVSSRTWIGGESSGVYPSLLVGDNLCPDYPVSEISVSTGSVLVYYDQSRLGPR